MQELAHNPTTPFGGRMTLAVLKTQRLVSDCGEGKTANKWQVFRQICEAKARLGVSDRALIVLQALLSFHRETVLVSGSEELVVFPSNRHLVLRAHGMPHSTLRRHLAALVDAGLIIRRDSPNGKRFAKKSHDGGLAQVYGFDLGPIVARSDEFDRIATELTAQRHRCDTLRQIVTVTRRDIVKMIAAGMNEQVPADWAALHRAYQTIVARIPRLASPEVLESLCVELRELAQQILALLHRHIGADPERPPQTRPEIPQHDTAVPNSLPSLASKTQQPDSLDEARAGEIGDHVPLRLVLEACPDIADYVRTGIRSHRDLLAAVEIVRPMLGISPSAWEDARTTMGREKASIVVSAILQRGVAIKNPGGYLRNLTGRAAAGQFSIWPMLMALHAARVKAEASAVPKIEV